MIVNFLSFLDPRKYYGGGEMITRSIISEGIKRKHTINVTSVRPKISSLDKTADIYILADIFNIGHTILSLGGWRYFSKELLTRISKKEKFIHITTAYADICNLPAIPCHGIRDTFCPVKVNLNLYKKLVIKDLSNNCFADNELQKNLHKNAILNVFLSPLHRQTTEKILRIKLENSFLLKPIIDTSMFKNNNIIRDIDYLYVGLISESKGLKEIKELYKKSNIHLAGPIHPDFKLDFGIYHGKISYNQVPNLMNRAKNFICLPKWIEPQARVVSEAALCGCNIISNKNVGALSFGMSLSEPKNYWGVVENFWDNVEKLI
jgi:glycosyltransferase involved in cell wall biosynthesis